MASDWEGVSIGFDHTMFEPNPTWTRIDTVVRVSRIEIKRGRQDEFERTDTGTATIFVNDTEGVFDSTNPGSPYFGNLDSKPIAIAIRDPVTDEWFPLFRGVIDDYGYDLHPSQIKGEVAIQCVDALDYLAGIEMAPGLFGDAPLPASAGYITFDETPPATVDVNDRINQMLGNVNVGWPSALQSIFTGNVRLLGQPDAVYSPGESVMAVLHDCADAEFPTVANLFADRFGFIVFHGRMARFDPDTVSASATHWDFHRWKVGDGAAILLDPDRAQLRPPFSFSRSRKMIRNAALCYPQGILGADMEAQVVTDQTSIDTYGYKPWSAENLLIAEGVTDGLTANEECALISQYIVENYAQPRNRIEAMTFRSVRPDDTRAAATWAFLTGVDISDVVDVAIGHPGGGGFSEEFYIEGISYEIRPLVNDLDTGYPDVTLSIDASPTAYWTTSPF